MSTTSTQCTGVMTLEERKIFYIHNIDPLSDTESSAAWLIPNIYMSKRITNTF